MFAAHCYVSVLMELSSNHIYQVFVLASCTRELLPLNMSVNDVFKALMKDSFAKWYAHEVETALDEGQVWRR